LGIKSQAVDGEWLRGTRRKTLLEGVYRSRQEAVLRCDDGQRDGREETTRSVIRKVISAEVRTKFQIVSSFLPSVIIGNLVLRNISTLRPRCVERRVAGSSEELAP